MDRSYAIVGILYSPIFSPPFYFTVLYLGQFHCHLFSLFLVQYRILGIHFKGNFMLSSNSLPIIFADSLQNRESRKLGGRENNGEYSNRTIIEHEPHNRWTWTTQWLNMKIISWIIYCTSIKVCVPFILWISRFSVKPHN